MALGDIKVLQENAQGTYDEVSLGISKEYVTATTPNQTVVVFTNSVTAGSLIFVNSGYVDDYTITGSNQITFPYGLSENDKITKIIQTGAIIPTNVLSTEEGDPMLTEEGDYMIAED